MSGVKLTKAQTKILRAIDERALDVFDLAAKTEIEVATVMLECQRLKNLQLVNWMYAEDEVCLEAAGRAALSTKTEGGE